MLRFLLILLIIAVLGCGKRPAEESSAPTLEGLRVRRDLYRQLLDTLQNQLSGNSGQLEKHWNAEQLKVHRNANQLEFQYMPNQWSNWFYRESCDGLLFESLLAVGRDREFNIEAAEIEPGRFYRNPSQSGCAHDTSRDMLTGILWYIWKFERLDIAERLWDYGEAHDWKMGEGDIRTVMSPGLVALLAQIIHELDGEDHGERHYRELIYSTEPGYTSHLSLLTILLDGDIRGNITSRQLQILRSISDRNPTNPLAQAAYHKYTDGEQSRAISLLLNTWPSDRLPTTADWCEEWRTQRAEGDSGFQPCDSINQLHSATISPSHSGGDLLFTAALLL